MLSLPPGGVSGKVWGKDGELVWGGGGGNKDGGGGCKRSYCPNLIPNPQPPGPDPQLCLNRPVGSVSSFPLQVPVRLSATPSSHYMPPHYLRRDFITSVGIRQ